MGKILKRLKKTDSLILLISLIIFLFIISLLLISNDNQNENQPRGERINNLNNEDSDTSTLPSAQVPAEPEEYPESVELLKNLPYYSNDFTVDYLPLERGSKPKLIVKLISPNASELFKQWLSQFEYDESELEIEYITNEPLHGPYDPQRMI
jgi:hypothetical protein